MFRNDFLLLLVYGQVLSRECLIFRLEFFKRVGEHRDSYSGPFGVLIYIMHPDLVVIHITDKVVPFNTDRSEVRVHLFHENI